MSYDFFGLNEMVKKLEKKVEKLEAFKDMLFSEPGDGTKYIPTRFEKWQTEQMNKDYLVFKEATSQRIDTLSAVMKEFFKYMRGTSPIGPDIVKNPFFQEPVFWALIKQLDGTSTEGEPSKQYDPTLRLVIPDSLIKEEQEAPFPQPPISRDTSILKDVKVGEAEPKDDALFWKHEYLTLKEVEIPKLIAEFLKSLERIRIGLGMGVEDVIEIEEEKWEGRKDAD